MNRPTNKRTSLCNIKNKIKNFDSYGTPIYLTYKKQTAFRSFLGGIVTIIIRLAILAYLIFQIMLIV
jgi:hypothetical protein